MNWRLLRTDYASKYTFDDQIISLLTVCSSLLQSLNLPGSLQALEKSLGLPLSLTSHAEEIRQQQGLHRICRSMHDVESLKANDVETYKEGVELLSLEATEDDQARLKHGTERWTRPSSRQAAEKLYAQVGEIDGYLKSANSSDELVKTKLKNCESVIRVLEGTDRDLEEYVPSVRKAAMPPKVEQEARRLRTILNEISHLESRRKKSIEKVRVKAKADDISELAYGVFILASLILIQTLYSWQKQLVSNESFQCRRSKLSNSKTCSKSGYSGMTKILSWYLTSGKSRNAL